MRMKEITPVINGAGPETVPVVSLPVVVAYKAPRKRTVTVVLGPRTVRMLERLAQKMQVEDCQGPASLTAMAGWALNECISSWRYSHLPDGEKVLWSHWD